MHVILSAFGSYGDVLPMAGLGAAMRRRGHRVQIITNPYFREVVEEAGLELLPLGSVEEYHELAQHADLWHPRRGLKLVLTRGVGAYLRQVYDLLTSNYVPGETVIAAHGLDLASRVFHDKVGAPLATVHFAPFAIMTLHDTPRYIGAPTVSFGPQWWKAIQFWAADRLIVDPIIAPAVNELRATLGLGPVRQIYHHWHQSPQLVIGLFPDWFAPKQPDWPSHTELVGFPLWDPRRAAGLPEEMDRFLDEGEPPIVFAPGSANFQAEEFFCTAVEACRLSGRRGVLMTKAAHQVPANLPPGVAHFDWAPFSLLLPRAAALVHHGGIGTCAQGLAAGVPQVVMPMAYDQLDNGLRLKRLGVGDVVRVRQFRGPKVAATIERLIDSATAPKRCRELAARCDGAAALERACELLEGLERHGIETMPANIGATADDGA